VWPTQWVPGSFPGGKAAKTWSYHLFPSSVEFKNEWGCTSAPPIRLNGVDRENCTFTLYQSNRQKASYRLRRSNDARSVLPFVHTKCTVVLWHGYVITVTETVLSLTDFLSWLRALTCSCQGLLLLVALCPGGGGEACWLNEYLRFQCTVLEPQWQ
jgi:hypothetical protein